MKNVKRITSVFIFVLLAITAGVLSSAHSGKTDASGGHTDSSTGEYHYHHGYPAHDHYDMDGDGIADCPYDFDDQTGANSGSSSAGGSVTPYIDNAEKEPEVVTVVETVTETVTVTEEVPYIPSWVYWAISGLALAAIVMFLVIMSKAKKYKEDISAQERQFNEYKNADAAYVKNGLSALNSAMVLKHGDRYLYDLAGAPPGDYVDKDMLPCSTPLYGSRWGIKYTFYLGSSPTRQNVKYHHNSCRYANYSYPINAYTLTQNTRGYVPCLMCRCRLPDTEWVTKYRKHRLFLEKYIDITDVIPDIEQQPTQKSNAQFDQEIYPPDAKVSWRDS